MVTQDVVFYQSHWLAVNLTGHMWNIQGRSWDSIKLYTTDSMFMAHYVKLLIQDFMH